jgi:hypothetical protein
MKQKMSKFFSGMIILALVFIIWFLYKQDSDVTKALPQSLPSLYIDKLYDFRINMPNGVVPDTKFKSFHLFGTNWRINAPKGSKGEMVAVFPVYKIDRGNVAPGQPYPLFFATEVRVGRSPDVKHCYDIDAGFSEQKIEEVTIGGNHFKKFSFSDAGMMKYLEGESFRIVHNNQCYVIERLKTGSNYKDETMLPGLSDQELDLYYQKTLAMIQTFAFTQ